MIYKDQIGHQVKIPVQAKRIISLVPSITELLFDLGLEKHIIACTKFCEHPEEKVKHLPKIGGTKTPHLDKIIDLNPDLIFAAKEENIKDHIETLRQHCPVYTSNVTDIPTAINMVQSIGDLTHTTESADSISLQIKTQAENQPSDKSINCLYLIWKAPYMCAGGDTYINSMLDWGGFKNLASDKDRYPSLSVPEILALEPELIMLSSEPFPFADKHLKEIEEQFPNSKIKLVDGQHFSWYGSRMTSSFDYIRLLKSSV